MIDLTNRKNIILVIIGVIVLVAVVILGVDYYLGKKYPVDEKGVPRKGLIKLSTNVSKDVIETVLPGKQFKKLTVISPSDLKEGERISKSELYQSEKKKIISKLPFVDKTQGISIEHLETADRIAVRISIVASRDDYRAKKKLAEDLIRSFGVGNLCNLAIIWGPPQDVKDKLTTRDLVTTGCLQGT